MSFTASTVRRVLYEGGPARFLYAIGNTQARAVLPAGQGPLEGTIRVLLLGCGDIRNALVTTGALRQLCAANSKSSAKQQQQQQQIEVHLNDLSDVILARDVLLLVIASSIDPSSSDDLQFLWDVWFNAALIQEHRARLDALLQQVLQGELPGNIVLADAPTHGGCSSSSSTKPLLARLQAIWKGWRGCNKSLQVVAAARRNFMLENANRRRQGAGCKDRLSWQEFVSFNSLETVLDRVVVDYHTMKASVKASMQAELKVYLEHGSILQSGLACQGPSVNPTLLDESCTWRVHDSCWPFDCFPPISQQQIKAGTSALPGLLTQLAQGALRDMVQQYQQAAGITPTSSSSCSSGSGGVRFVVHGGDGVGLCAAGSSLGDETRFNAIDCSNVGDHAGLLNVLLATGPRLVPDPRSRIHIDTMIWQNGGDANLPAYLNKSFGGSASFLPTFTGLRLCSETRFGRLQPYSMHDFIASRSSNTRQLEFAAAAPSAQAALALHPVSSSSSRSSSSGCTAAAGGSQEAARASLAASTVQLPPEKSSSSSGGVKEYSLADALLQLETICCLRRSVIASGAIGCDIALQTTATLARLLASACVWGRMRLQSSSSNGSSSSSSSSSGGSDDGSSGGGSSSVWQRLCEVPKLWPLAQRHQLAWRASWHWLLQAAVPAAAAAAKAEAAAVNGLHSVPQQLPPPPVVFTGYMQPSTMSMAARMCPTPEVAVVLITESAASILIGADVLGDGNSMMKEPGMQFATAQFANTRGGERMRVFPAYMHVMGLWAQEKDSQVPAGAHLLDNIVVEPHPEHAMREPMKVSFLLPADHGLDPTKTWVGLVQQMIGCLQCLPSRLSEFQSTPLLAPSPLLLPPHLQSPSEGGSLPNSADAQLQQQQQQWQLQLVDLQESTTSYTATIKLVPSSSSSSQSSAPCSGLQAEPVAMVAGGVEAATAKAPSHEVVLSLKQPAGVTPFRLLLLHPVQTSNAEYKLSRSTGTITGRLFKSPDPDYPCDLNPPMGLGLLEQLRVDKLPALPASVDRLGFWMTEMFTHAENAAKVHNPHGGLGDPLFDLRETLKILFVCSLKGETIYRMTDKDAAPGPKEEAAMYIRVHTPLHRQAKGRPIALVSVVDNDLANKLLKEGKIDQMEEVNRFVDVIHSQISKNNTMRNCICSRRELALLRALLLRNSRRMQPTPWQQKHLALGANSPWLATYITPLYPEDLGNSSTLMDALTPEVMERTLREARQGASAGGGARAAAANGAGNAASMRQAAARSGTAAGSRSGPSNSAAAAAAAGDDRAGTGSGQSCRVCGIKAGASVTLMRCSRCKAKTDWYCSRDCQKADWGRHKKGCTPA